MSSDTVPRRRRVNKTIIVEAPTFAKTDEEIAQAAERAVRCRATLMEAVDVCHVTVSSSSEDAITKLKATLSDMSHQELYMLCLSASSVYQHLLIAISNVAEDRGDDIIQQIAMWLGMGASAPSSIIECFLNPRCDTPEKIVGLQEGLLDVLATYMRKIDPDLKAATAPPDVSKMN